MKTMLKVAMVVALFAFANTVSGTGNLKVNIMPLSAEKAVVAISTLSNSNFSITVADEMERIVYYNENSEPGEYYRKVFNFSDLEAGKYILRVVSNDLTTERPFEKTSKGIKVGEEKTILEPFFGYEDGLLRCTYLNFPNENVKLTLFENDQLLYSKNVGRTFNVNEGLNLSKLTRGNYVAVLSTGGKEYVYEININ